MIFMHYGESENGREKAFDIYKYRNYNFFEDMGHSVI